jgi:hypothetical protein
VCYDYRDTHQHDSHQDVQYIRMIIYKNIVMIIAMVIVRYVQCIKNCLMIISMTIIRSVNYILS